MAYRGHNLTTEDFTLQNPNPIPLRSHIGVTLTAVTTTIAAISCLLVVVLVLGSSTAIAEETEVLAEVARILPSELREKDLFGFRVALDGDRVAVGTPYRDEVGPLSESGAVYLFHRNAEGDWYQEAKLQGPDPGIADFFGNRITLHGDRIAIQGYDGYVTGEEVGQGWVYVFERDLESGTEEWIQTAAIRSDDAEEKDGFGSSLHLEGDRLVIGAPYDADDDDGGDAFGSAYVYERNGVGEWVQQTKLTLPDGAPYQHFGDAIDLEGDRLAVGADQYGESGAVHLFERAEDGTWAEAARLYPDDGTEWDHFAGEISLDGDRIAVGSVLNDYWDDRLGAVYLFERDSGGDWYMAQKLKPLDADAETPYFGDSISLDGDRLVVGAPSPTPEPYIPGSVYVFVRNPEGYWAETMKINPFDSQPGDMFGGSVAVAGERIVIGAESYDLEGDEAVGALSIFDTVRVSPDLTVTGDCPGTVHVQITDATPRDGVKLFSAAALGHHILGNGSCAGTEINLDSPRLVLQQTNDFEGAFRISGTIAESLCGRFLQVVDRRTCLTTGTVQLPGTPADE